MPAETPDQVAHHLERLVVAYWHDVDFNWGRNATAHYTANAAFVAPGTRYEGREQIRAFYAWREERGARVNVHIVGNFHLAELGGNEAEAHWICTLFAHDGEAPQPAAPPIAISRVEDRFVREEDGEWRCRERRWHTLFKGDTPTTRMSPDEMAKRVGRPG